jgi:hypothetical protein
MNAIERNKADNILDEIEVAILSHVPELFNRLGLVSYTYYKKEAHTKPFRINDKDRSYVYSTLQCLESGLAENVVDFDLSAYLYKNGKLDISNLNMVFENADHALLMALLKNHNVYEYLDNYKEIEKFVLTRSAIVESVKPKIQFDSMGLLKNFGLQFEYKKEVPATFPRIKPYYTNSLEIFNDDLFKCYEVKNREQALTFSKMSYLSIADEHLQELFETEDWLELYQIFERDPAGCISLYDMTRI